MSAILLSKDDSYSGLSGLHAVDSARNLRR
jgi:hypothetical protein